MDSSPDDPDSNPALAEKTKSNSYQTVKQMKD